MACRSDYSQEQKHFDDECTRVINFLNELETGYLDPNFMKKKEYGLNQAVLDYKTEQLCTRLQSVDVSKYSLDLQIWWRDHLRADVKRIQDELDLIKTTKEKSIALAKLTPHEREILGITNSWDGLLKEISDEK